MSHRIIISVQNSLSRALPDLEPEEQTKMECAYLLRHGESPEEAGRKAGKLIARMIRETANGAHDHDHKED